MKKQILLMLAVVILLVAGGCECIKDYMSSYGKFEKGEHYYYTNHQYHYVVKLNKANRVVFGKDLFSSCFEVIEYFIPIHRVHRLTVVLGTLNQRLKR